MREGVPPAAGGMGAGAGTAEALPEGLLHRLAALALAADAAGGAAEVAAAEAALDAALPPATRAAFERDAAAGAVVPGGCGDAPWWEGSPALGFPGFAEAGVRPALPPLASLRAGGAAAVAPAVGFGVLEALFAYAHACRLHGACAGGGCGGGPEAASAAEALLAVASSLREDVRHPSAAAACVAALAASGAPAVRRTPLPSPALALETLRDDVCGGLLGHGRCVVDALLLAEGWLAAEGVRRTPAAAAAAAKLRFYAAWAEAALLRAPRGRAAAALAQLAAGAWAAYDEGAAALVGEDARGDGAAGGGGGGPAAGRYDAAAPLLRGSAALMHAAAQLPAVAKLRR